MFLETIRIQSSLPQHLAWHQQRVDSVFLNHFPGVPPISLAGMLPPMPADAGVYKLRIAYDSEVRELGVAPYTPRPVASLRLVRADGICYAEKSADRSALTGCFALRGWADDVLMVRNGLLTDTSICNIALGREGGPWFTPAHPLLPGTTRARLLSEGVLSEADLSVGHLMRFPLIALFNAMLPFGQVVLPTAAVLPLV